MKKLAAINSIMTVLFLALIFIPAMYGLMLPKNDDADIENRRLAELPPRPLNLSQWRDWSHNFEDYYQDHFGYRYSLLAVYRHLKFFMGDSPVSKVILGREQGWLFYDDPQDGDNLDSYRNVNQFGKRHLRQLVRRLLAKSRWLKKQGIEYLFVVAPSKQYIYVDKLPVSIRRLNRVNLIEQLKRALKQHPQLNVIFLQEHLQSADQSPQLYYKADTHWNYYGANIAQYIIAKKLKSIYPISPSPRLFGSGEFINKDMHSGDLALMLGLGEYFLEQDYRPDFPECTIPQETQRVLMTQCISGAVKALVYRDSFFTILQPFVSMYLDQGVYVWKKFNRDDARKRISINKPDIVIEEWVDRYLPL